MLSLYRAVYRDADVYLLDAPFTHLDIATEKEIFERSVDSIMLHVGENSMVHVRRGDKGDLH